jgi:hypothetical protein
MGMLLLSALFACMEKVDGLYTGIRANSYRLDATY